MTQYNILNVKLPNLQLNKLKSGIKNSTEVPLNISWNVISNSNNETNFLHKLLITKAFANNSSANTKLSKTQLHKIGQSGGFLWRLLGPLLKTGLPLIGNVLKPLAISILIPLGLAAAGSTSDAACQKKIFGSGTTTLTILNKKMNYIMKIIKSLEESGVLIKVVGKTITNEEKETKGGFLNMLLGALGASLFGNLWTVKGVIRASEGTIRAGDGAIATSQEQGTIRASQDC